MSAYVKHLYNRFASFPGLRPSFKAIAFLCIATRLGVPCPAQTATPASAAAAFESTYGSLPMSFEANQGQTDARVRFLSRGEGYSLFLTDSEAVLQFRHKQAADLVRMKLEGATHGVQVAGVNRLSATANYFIGADPAGWRTGVPAYTKVEYAGIYPGIDLVYYGNQRQLEYDFLLAPRANADLIRLHFEGTQQLRLAANGDLAIVGRHGEVEFHKPVVYQTQNGQRQPVAGRFELAAGHTVRFRIGNYDHDQPLVIDPTLAYSTYLGGSGGDQGTAIAVDSSGNAYIAGSTASANFPVSSTAFHHTNKAATAGGMNVFVTKLTPGGGPSALAYSTYLGGSTNDQGAGIAVDKSGYAYVTGLSESSDFPVTSGAFQTTNKAAGSYGPNAFVTKVNTTGSALAYSTFLGGDNYDFATAIAVDSTGNAYVTGFAGSLDFPVTKGAYSTMNGSGESVFVTKVNGAGTGLDYSTFITGGSDDHSTSIAVSSGGNAFIAGYTESSDYPVTASAFQKTNKSGHTGFVTKLSAAGTSLAYSTYLGGSKGQDEIHGIAIDASGNAYLGGRAGSSDFPIVNGSYKTVIPNASGSGFTTKLNAAASALVYSTFLGGSDSTRDQVNGISIDAAGEAYVTGATYSTNFPVTSGAFQTSNKAEDNFSSNAFLTKFNSTGKSLLYSTYLGGSGNSSEDGDTGNAVAVDSSGNAYLTGVTYSTDFPTQVPVRTGNRSPTTGTGFVAKFAFSLASTTTLTSSANPQKYGGNVTFTATVKPASGTGTPGGTVAFSVDGVTKATETLNGSGVAQYSTTALAIGSHTITATYSGSSTYSGSKVSLAETIDSLGVAGTPKLSPGAGTYTGVQHVTMTSSTSGATIYFTINGDTPTTSSTKYTSAISVGSSKTVKAIAVATGYTESAIASATYTIH